MAKNQNNNVAPATQKTDPGAKKDALATALAQIEKQFGKGAVMKLGDNAAMQVRVAKKIMVSILAPLSWMLRS